MSKTLIGTFYQLHTLFWYIAHKECFIQISMISLVIYSHIQVHNISILEFSGIWDTMANNLIHRTKLIITKLDLRTNTFREEVVIQRGWIRITLYTFFQHNLINFLSCDTNTNSTSSSI